jgi:hypothetical protein
MSTESEINKKNKVIMEMAHIIAPSFFYPTSVKDILSVVLQMLQVKPLCAV